MTQNYIYELEMTYSYQILNNIFQLCVESSESRKQRNVLKLSFNILFDNTLLLCSMNEIRINRGEKLKNSCDLKNIHRCNHRCDLSKSRSIGTIEDKILRNPCLRVNSQKFQFLFVKFRSNAFYAETQGNTCVPESVRERQRK